MPVFIEFFTMFWREAIVQAVESNEKTSGAASAKLRCSHSQHAGSGDSICRNRHIFATFCGRAAKPIDARGRSRLRSKARITAKDLSKHWRFFETYAPV
jgi:hypothetical protein